MQTTAFRNQSQKGDLLSDDRSAAVKACNLLMRTKGWSKALAEGYVKTLQPDELDTLAKLEDAPSLRGDEVNQVIDEIEDRQAAEEALKKQHGSGDRSQESPEEE